MACVFGTVTAVHRQATGLTYGPILATEAVIIVTGLGIYAYIRT
jgi:hypothetical protein